MNRFTMILGSVCFISALTFVGCKNSDSTTPTSAGSGAMAGESMKSDSMSGGGMMADEPAMKEDAMMKDGTTMKNDTMMKDGAMANEAKMKDN